MHPASVGCLIRMLSTGDLALLQHDKPLAKGNSAPHLKHIPAYLRDATIATPSFPGNAGKGTFVMDHYIVCLHWQMCPQSTNQSTNQ